MITQVQSIFDKLLRKGEFNMMETKIKMIDDCLLRDLTWRELREIVDLAIKNKLIIDISKEVEMPDKYKDFQYEEFSIDNFGYMKLSMYLTCIESYVGSVIYCYDDSDKEYIFIAYTEVDEACCEILDKYNNIKIDMVY